MELDLNPEVGDALKRAADADGVSPAMLVQRLVRDHLMSTGYLPADQVQGLRPDQLNAGNDG